jgi:hypothetical protein
MCSMRAFEPQVTSVTRVLGQIFILLCLTNCILDVSNLLNSVMEAINILLTTKMIKANWIGHILRRDCLLKHVTEGKTEVTGRRGRRRKQLLDDLKEKRRISEIERGSTRSHSVQNSLWNRVQICR